MMTKYKNILITGASSGIGAALAFHYASSSVILHINGRNDQRLEETANLCRKKGAKVFTSLVNVSNKEEMDKWVTDAGEHQSLDLVIANAGISGGTGGRLDGEPVQEARKIFDVNVTGVFNTVEPSLKMMQKNKAGQIAIVSSLAGFRGLASCPAYSASKGAVRFYGEALRGALNKTNIKINVICPGFVISRITDENDFPMPFIMNADKAAKIIAYGLERNKGRIAFPFPMHFLCWFIGILPDAIAQKLIEKSPAKKALIN